MGYTDIIINKGERVEKNNNLFLIATVAILVLLFSSCSLILDSHHAIKVSNSYNQPVNVTVKGEEVTIPAYSSHTFEFSYSLDSIAIYAKGDYFYFYNKDVNLGSGTTIYHSLKQTRDGMDYETILI